MVQKPEKKPGVVALDTGEAEMVRFLRVSSDCRKKPYSKDKVDTRARIPKSDPSLHPSLSLPLFPLLSLIL